MSSSVFPPGPYFGEPYDTEIAVIFFALALGAWRPVRMTLRMTRPIPEQDRKAIERVLLERGQQPTNVAKLWLGGPWHYLSPFIPIPFQGGRPYSVEVGGGSGAAGTTKFVVEGADIRGDPVVKEHGPGGWKVVSRLRPASSPFNISGSDEAGLRR